MIELYGILQEQESINAELGLGVDYYKGEKGEPGKTPVKGVDYFTDAEITEIKDEIAEKVQVGAKGEDGKSAYQLAVEAGYEGSETEWLASLKGKDGTNGINGTNGVDGKDGINGVDGKTPVKGVDYFTAAEIQQIENEAAAKVDLSEYAKTADLSTVATSGSYNDLSDKPSIPEAYELPVASATVLGGVKVGSGLSITNGVLAATGGGTADSVDWSKVQNKPTFADVATSGSYNDLTDKPTIPEIPTNVSAFENDKGYLTEHQSLVDYAKKTEIPTVPTKVSAFENDKGYLTEHQSLEGYAKTADLATVAKTGSYNDLTNKPTIPSITGLATETYVNGKIAEIDIPTIPTNISAFTNDAGYLTEHQSLTEYAKKADIPAPYTLPTASTSTLGGVKVDGSTITISDGVISSVGGSGGSEPQKYIKDASVSGNTLTLTKKDDTTIDFTPSGGSGGAGVSGYAFSSSQTFTGEDKAHLKEVITGKNIYMSIDGLTVIRMMSIGGNRGFIVANLNGGTDNVVKVYTVTCDSNLNVVSSQFSLMLSYALLGSSNQYAAAITSDNIGDYIKPWNITTDSSDSNLYNAKELVIEFLSNNVSSGRTTFYYNFGDSTLGSDIQRFYAVPWSIDNIGSGYINYNGSSIELNNASSWNIEYICYKT